MPVTALGIVPLLVSAIFSWRGVEGFSSGPPAAACGNLAPSTSSHGAPQLDPSPWQVNLSSFDDGRGNFSYSAGETYTLSFSSPSGSRFRGFMLQGRVVADDTTPAGSFTAVDGNTILSSCSPQNLSVVHNSRVLKEVITTLWTAPPPGTGPIRIGFAVVMSQFTYWANQRSHVIYERIPRPDALLPFGTSVGDAAFPDSDDGASDPITFQITFFNKTERDLFVNANGILSFGTAFSDFLPEVFPLGGHRSDSLIALYWDDHDVRNVGEIYYRRSQDQSLLNEIATNISDTFSTTFSPTDLFIATWDGVVRFLGSNLNVNTYQVVIATDGSETYVLFLFRDVQWSRTVTSIGFNAGDGTRGFNLPKPSGSNDYSDVESNNNAYRPGSYYFRVDTNTIMEPEEPRLDALLPFGTLFGDSPFPPTLDGAQGPLNFICTFFGTSEDTLFVNANGIISFRNSFNDFTPDPFPTSSSRLIALYWDDHDARSQGEIYNRTSQDQPLLNEIGRNISEAFSTSYIPSSLFIATWDGVRRFLGSSSDVNTYQVVIATDGSETYVLFLYRDVQWSRTQSSIGFNAGDGIHGFNLPRPSGDDTFLNIESTSNVYIPGSYYFRVDQDMIVEPLPLRPPANVTVMALSSTILEITWMPPVSSLEPIFWTVEISQVQIQNSLMTVDTSSADITTVTLTGLTKDTNYQVRVASIGTRGQREFSDYVQEQTLADINVPSAPQNVIVKGVSSFALNVTWEPPTDNGGSPILGYVITVNETSIEVGTTVNFFLVASTEFLMDNTTYEVSVAARNIQGVGNISTVLQTTIPLTPPVLNTPTSVTATTLSLSWTQPGSAADSYTVSYSYTIRQCGSGVMSGSNSEVISDGNTRSFILSGLEEDSDYTITLTANSAIRTLVSNQVSATTITAAPSGGPSSITFGDRNSTSITVQWGQIPCSERNGEITGYTVEYSSINPPHSGSLTVSGANTRTSVVGSLLPSTTYTFSVRAQGASSATATSETRATTQHTDLSFFHRGNFFPNNSIVLLSGIGEGSEALFCLTPSTDCCTSRGDWRKPSGSAVSTSTTSDFYFLRGSGILLLNRRSSATGPTGIFRCIVPPSSSTPAQTLYVGIYQNQGEGSLNATLTYDAPSRTLSCVSSGGPVSTVTWRRNGDLITSTSPYQLSQILMSGVTSTFLNVLTITGGNAEDYNGTFSCTVSNSRGSASQSLDIHNVLITGNTLSHTVNASVAITCASDLDVATIRWLNTTNDEQEDVLLSGTAQQLGLPIDTIELQLNNTMYTCEVTVTLATGPATIMETVTIIIGDPPPRVPVLLMSTNITTSSATIQWTVMGIFNPDNLEEFVVMYGLSSEELSMSSSVITANSDSQTYSTQLNSLDVGTEYFYRVLSRIDSEISLSDVESFTTSDDQSGVVSDLQLNSPNDTTLLISWGEPASPIGNILHYSISITNLRDGSTEERQRNENTLTESGLEPGVPYSVSVAAVNRAGTGEFNAVITFTTEITPSIAPGNVRVNRPFATVMVVSWQPLTLSEAKGFISYYTVTYSPQITSSGRKRQAAMTERVEGMDANTTRIEDLDPDTAYSVSVSASTAAGEGVQSASVFSAVSMKAQCPVLSHPANGMVTVTGQMSGDTATYTCNPDFGLDVTTGSSTRTCQTDGTWSGSDLQCNPFDGSSSADTGAVVGGVVAVILIAGITIVFVVLIVHVFRGRHGKEIQQEIVASKEGEGIEDQFYSTIPEDHEYETISVGRSHLPPSRAEEFALEQCPAYAPSTVQHKGNEDADSNVVYETVSPA